MPPQLLISLIKLLKLAIVMISSDTTITSCIDWLSITNDNFYFPVEWDTERKSEQRGLMGYTHQQVYRDGRILLTNQMRPEMGTHLIMSGNTIQNLSRKHHTSTYEIAELIAGNATRIDLAIDIKLGSLNIAELDRLFDIGNAITKAKKGLYYRGSQVDGETLYIGAPKSKQRCRIYDKQAEQGTDYLWTRIELQLRHGYARAAKKRLNGNTRPHDATSGTIRAFVDFDNRDWRMAVNSEASKLTDETVYKNNRLQWLLDTATSALAEEMITNIEQDKILNTFIQSTLKKYALKKEKYKN